MYYMFTFLILLVVLSGSLKSTYLLGGFLCESNFLLEEPIKSALEALKDEEFGRSFLIPVGS